MMRSVHKLSTPDICSHRSQLVQQYSILALLLQYQKCSNVQKSMLAYALLLTWNLEPLCGSVSLQSERGREGWRERGGREGGRERGGMEGGRGEGGGEGVTPVAFMHNVCR